MKEINEKEFERLLTVTETEAICIESYMCLKEDEVDGPYGRWGWNKKLEEIRDHFLFAFVVATILQYNQQKAINKISDEFVMGCLEGAIWLPGDFSDVEEKFFDKWYKIQEVEDFKELKVATKKLCEYLTSLGYKMNFILYKNPKKALSKALELDRYLPDGEPGFGEFLRANIKDEY